MSDKRNATQRIEDLERALMSLFQTCDNMARDLILVKDALKILGNKVDSIREASGLTDEQVGTIMTNNNVKELKEKVDGLVAQGVLAPTDTVSDTSFVVGEEVNEQGETVNPRLQFALSALQPELQEKLKGAKSGDVVTFQEGKLNYKVTEVYAIQQPEEDGPAEATEQAAEQTDSAEATSSEAANS